VNTKRFGRHVLFQPLLLPCSFSLSEMPEMTISAVLYKSVSEASKARLSDDPCIPVNFLSALTSTPS